MPVLSFRPRGPEGATAARVCYLPGPHYAFERSPYVGREWDENTREHRASAEPFSVTDPRELPIGEERRVSERMVRFCRSGDLWPADKHTAARCGVEFTELERNDDGEWVRAKAPKKRKQSASESSTEAAVIKGTGPSRGRASAPESDSGEN